MTRRPGGRQGRAKLVEIGGDHRMRLDAWAAPAGHVPDPVPDDLPGDIEVREVIPKLVQAGRVILGAPWPLKEISQLLGRPAGLTAYGRQGPSREGPVTMHRDADVAALSMAHDVMTSADSLEVLAIPG